MKATKKSRANHSSSGQTILEMALVMLTLIPVGLGAFDLAVVFNAKSSTKAAVETALRCLYAVDSDCVQVNPSHTVPFYSYTKTNITTTTPSSEYAGEARFIERPIKQRTNFQAQTLSKISYTVDLYNVDRAAGYQAVQPIRYIKAEHLFPYVHVGTDPRHPTFRKTSDGDSAEIAPTIRKIRASPKNAMKTDVNSIGVSSGRTIRLGNAWGSQWQNLATVLHQTTAPACFTSANTTGETLTSATSCNQTEYKTVVSRIAPDGISPIIWIEGTLSKVNIGGVHHGRPSCGYVNIHLRKVGQRGGVDLGGQEVSDNANRDENFHPRGAVAALVVGTSSNDMTVHIDDTKMDYTSKYEIRFDLTQKSEIGTGNSKIACDDTNPVKFKVDAINIFLPSVTVETANLVCGNSMFPNEGCSYACNPELPNELKSQAEDKTTARTADLGLVAALVDESKPVKRTDIQTFAPAIFPVDNDGRAWADGYLQHLSAAYSVPICAHSLSTTATARTEDCPMNKGIQPGLSTTETIDDVLLICKPSAGTYKDFSWTLSGYQPVSGITATPYTRTSCAAPMDPPEPAEFTSYADRKSDVVVTGKDLVASGAESPNYPKTDPKDPNNLVSNPNSAYGCGDFSVKTVALKDPKEAKTKCVSHFGKNEDNLDACNWQQSLRYDAVNCLGYNQNTFLAFSRSPDRDVECDAGYASAAGCSVRCIQNLSTETIPGIFPASTKPAVCSQSGISCAPSLHHIESTGEPLQRITNNAENKAFSQLSAFSPWVKKCLSGDTTPGCVNVDIKNEEDDTGPKFTVQAKVQVPLITLLGKKSIEISATDSAHGEESFAR